MKKIFENPKILLYIGVVVGFIAITVIYFSPILKGHALLQPDIIHSVGSAKELRDFRSETGEETYWSNAMFGGMPTYQTGAQYPYDVMRWIDSALRFLPRPADYMFLLLAGFFFLMMVWKNDWKIALFSAIAFAFTSYFSIILAAGHNGKLHTICYFAPTFAGIVLLFRNQLKSGFFVTAIFGGLQFAANHIQMTYYFFIVVGFFLLAKLYEAFIKKELKPYFISVGVFFCALVFALSFNAARLWTTYEYSNETTRGASELTSAKKKGADKGLEKDYIVQWSYGILETGNLFIPNLMGGASSDDSFDPKSLKKLFDSGEISQKDYTKYARYITGSPYWGEQPFTAGPAYQGAVVIFLFLVGLFFLPRKHLIWIIPSSVLVVMLSWGKNFMPLTEFFIDYVPLYNKFRAVSSILVALEFIVPIAVGIALYRYFFTLEISSLYKRKILTWVGGGILLIIILVYLLGTSLLPFANYEEQKHLPQYILDAIKEDRIAIFKKDVLRTFIFSALVLLGFFVYENRKIKKDILLLALSALCLIDLFVVNKRYLNSDNFVEKSLVENPFVTEPSDRLLARAEQNPNLLRLVYGAEMNKALENLKEKDTTHYRVFNLATSTFQETNTSYFHQSLGGYHAAKLRKYQDIIDRFFSSPSEKMLPILNMLNAKYIVSGDMTKPEIIPNPDTNGNAWMVGKIIPVKTADEEIALLSKINNKREAILREKELSSIKGKEILPDTTAYIKLESYRPNRLIYESKSKTPQIGVFSEIYYPHGWKAKVDDKESPIFKVNYLLRGIYLPEGKHKIVFEFTPNSVNLGSSIALVSFLLFVLITLLLYKKFVKLKK